MIKHSNELLSLQLSDLAQVIEYKLPALCCLK
jgi:hypothetical protein